MIVDKIGQPLELGDFVASAVPSYGEAAPTLVVGTIEKITYNGNVSIKQLFVESAQWANEPTVFKYSSRRMIKLTGSQLDSINLKLDMVNAKATA